MRIILYLLLILSPTICTATELPSGILGVKIVDIINDEVIYEKNPDLPLVPASIHKVITAYAGLKILGSDFRFRTSLLQKDNNLYIKFRGDPEFNRKALNLIIRKIKSIKNINNITIDGTVFDDQFWTEQSLYGDQKFCFAAPVSAINFEKNCFKMDVKHSNNLGLRITPQRQPFLLKLKNSIAMDRSIDATCEMELKANSDNSYNLYGCYKKYGVNPSLLNIAVQNPKLYIKVWIEKLAQKNGITYNNISFDKAPIQAKEIFFTNSRPLKKLVEVMLLESDNLIAEVILKQIAITNSSPQGNWKDGLRELRNFLKNTTQSQDFKIFDGSGSSRKNLITANIMIQLLRQIDADEEIRKHIITALPVAARRGNLETRFKHSTLGGKLFAKTGAMDNISSLAGYIFHKDKKYAMVLIINNSLLSSNERHKFQEKLLKNLYSKYIARD